MLYVDGLLDWLSGAAKSLWGGVKNIYNAAKPVIDVVLPVAQGMFPQHAQTMQKAKGIADTLLSGSQDHNISAGYTPSEYD